MKYSEFKASDAYTQKHSGSGVRIALYKGSEAAPLIESTTGINATDDFETLPVEEAGEDGVDEQVTGRHSGSGTLNGFWSPEREDKLPNRQNFIAEGNGVEYTIMELAGDNRIGEDLPLRVFVGCKISRYGSGHGARGLKTIDLAFNYTRRYSGQQWADLTGNS